jgi:hypothetical protein
MLSGDELIPRLTELYQQIDEAYRTIAEEIGLTCEGCDGVRCCTVDLMLHTFIEMHHLRRGFNTLDPGIQREVLARCRTMIAAKEDDPYGEAYRGSVCALNFYGKCVLYAYRPMICRLAGIPHLIIRPDGRKIESGGCNQYTDQISQSQQNVKIDRTEYYRTMASFEMAVVRNAGQRTRPCTVAETLGREDLSF